MTRSPIPALALLLASCAAQPAPPPGPFVTLAPPRTASPVPAASAAATAAPAAAVRRDTAALERQVRGYLRRPDSQAEKINDLSTLLLQTRRAVERMEVNRRKGLFRVPDITAARVAADGLAAYLQTRTQPAAPPPEPPPADPAE